MVTKGKLSWWDSTKLKNWNVSYLVFLRNKVLLVVYYSFMCMVANVCMDYFSFPLTSFWRNFPSFEGKSLMIITAVNNLCLYLNKCPHKITGSKEECIGMGHRIALRLEQTRNWEWCPTSMYTELSKSMFPQNLSYLDHLGGTKMRIVFLCVVY